jgi:hypothetical protein
VTYYTHACQEKNWPNTMRKAALLLAISGFATETN